MRNSFESRDSGRRCCVRAFMPAAVLVVASAFAMPAHAMIYTVGKSGLSNNCSFPAVQQALTVVAGERAEVGQTRSGHQAVTRQRSDRQLVVLHRLLPPHSLAGQPIHQLHHATPTLLLQLGLLTR